MCVEKKTNFVYRVLKYYNRPPDVASLIQHALVFIDITAKKESLADKILI